MRIYLSGPSKMWAVVLRICEAQRPRICLECLKRARHGASNWHALAVVLFNDELAGSVIPCVFCLLVCLECTLLSRWTTS